jgi:hypothetical protein
VIGPAVVGSGGFFGVGGLAGGVWALLGVIALLLTQ